MARERAGSSFVVEEMTFWLDGDAQRTETRRRAFEAVISDPILNDGLARFTMSVEEERRHCTRKVLRLFDLIAEGEEDGWAAGLLKAMEIQDPAVAIRALVQRGLWMDTLRQQGTDAQQAVWLPGSERYQVIGCFAMTELGHSSFLRGAETVAVFDAATDGFFINSTALTAAKWWIGQAGQTATHAIVFANLMTQGAHRGIQLFVVPLRDPETGFALPGITIGDIGPKYGRHGNDNGYILLDNVWVPRFNMLARWSSVDADGTFHAPPTPAVAYGSTVFERVVSVQSAVDYTAQGLLSALRYGVVRRQSPDRPPRQIIDFQTHKAALLPHLARCYATVAVCRAVRAEHAAALASLHAGDTQAYLARLPDLHALSCALKAHCTWWATRALEACRRAMGGHGYHAYSAIPRLIADFGVVTTGGGDNIVIAQQTARFLLRQWRRAAQGTAVQGSAAYLCAPHCQAHATGALVAVVDAGAQGWMAVPLRTLADTCEALAAAMIADADHRLRHLTDHRGLSHGDAWNDTQCDLVDATEAHANAYMVRVFTNAVQDAPEAVAPVLASLARLFALQTLADSSPWLVMHRIVPADLAQTHLRGLNDAVHLACDALRPDAIALTDAFDIPDALMRAPLARADGDVYTAYVQAATSHRLHRPVAPYWGDLLQARTSKRISRL